MGRELVMHLQILTRTTQFPMPEVATHPGLSKTVQFTPGDPVKWCRAYLFTQKCLFDTKSYASFCDLAASFFYASGRDHSFPPLICCTNYWSPLKLQEAELHRQWAFKQACLWGPHLLAQQHFIMAGWSPHTRKDFIVLLDQRAILFSWGYLGNFGAFSVNAHMCCSLGKV